MLRQDEEKGLCTRCCSIDFEKIFNTPIKRRFDPQAMLDLGRLGPEVESEKCDLCKLFNAVKRECGRHKNEFAAYTHGHRKHYDSKVGGYRRVTEVLCKSCSKFGRRPEGGDLCITCDVSDERAREALLCVKARFTSSTFIDFNMVRSWVAKCKMSKTQYCVKQIETSVSPQNFKLIHCRDRKVVEAGLEANYTALSYVWGSEVPRSEKTLINGQLSSSLPQTIEDAMEVTRRLGLTFIWIDRYCIDQDNEAEKHVQLRQMDLIYRKAFLTIVAAAGKDPQFGLPGVGPTPRFAQPAANTRIGKLVAIPKVQTDIINTSTWMTRAWTFQEGFFSARRLIFTEQQVYYTCRDAWTSEMTPEVWTDDGNYLFSEYKTQNRRPWDITAPLSSYSMRSLSFTTDALNAFEGIFHDFETGRYPVSNYRGVLLMPDCVAGRNGSPKKPKKSRGKSDRFIAGLCWRSVGKGERRDEFPSWSWAGWTCKISAYHPELSFNSIISAELRPRIHVEESDGSLIHFERISSTDRTYKPGGPILHIEAWAIPLNILEEPLQDRLFGTEYDKFSSGLSDSEEIIFANFEDEKHILGIPIQFLHLPEITKSTDIGNMIIPHKNKIRGILLSQSVGPQKNECFFFWVIEDLGNCFRRIGHFDIPSYRRYKTIWKNKPDKERMAKLIDIPRAKRMKMLLQHGERLKFRLQ